MSYFHPLEKGILYITDGSDIGLLILFFFDLYSLKSHDMLPNGNFDNFHHIAQSSLLSIYWPYLQF